MRRLAVMFVLVSLLSLSIFASSVGHEKYIGTGPYKFDLLFVPEEVEAKAGENTTFDILVANKGSFALRNFNVTLSGTDYEYGVTPRAADILVWGEWDSVNGLKRGQQPFQVIISVPLNATGVHLVTLTAKENFSWRKVTQEKIFILKVIPAAEPNLTVSNILVPEDIRENETFDIKFSASNNNAFKQQFDFLLSMPSDWHTTDNKKSVLLEPFGSANVSFTVTPTNSTGNVSVDVVYPFEKNVLSLTREGKALVPIEEQEQAPRVTGFARIMEFLRNLSPIVLSIVVLIAIIVVWFIVKVVRFYSSRKKPETMKKTNAIGLS